MTNTSPNAALWYAMVSILFWSTVASIFKLSLRSIDFISLVFYASFVSMLVLGGLCVAKGKFAALGKWQTKDYLRSLFLGALNPALYYIILFRAYDLLPAQEAQVLNFVWPIVLILMGVLFLGQKLNIVGVFSVIVSFLGVVIVATHGNILSLQFSSDLGVGLALASTIIWAGYWVINQADKQDSLLRLLMNFVAGVIWLSIIMTITNHWSAPAMPALLGAIYIGLFEMSLAFYCWFQALKYTTNISFISNLIFLTPFFSLIFIALILKEPIYPSTVIGLVLICGSIILHQIMNRR